MKTNTNNFSWTLSKTNFKYNKGNVFSCFACGGGSTMGYKLAGFNVIGFNEIDPKMAELYIANHNPKFSFIEPIQNLKTRDDLPKELYNLDILDGSPPCSAFSMMGLREKSWGQLRYFKEGQEKQVLDTLFFDFIDLAAKLQPKIVVAENVKGLVLGNAKMYVSKIYEHFNKAGCVCNHYLLDSSRMGVPQKRERIFFICIRKDLAMPFLSQINLFEKRPILKLEFNKEKITFSQIADYKGRQITSKNILKLWNARIKGDKSLRDINLRLNNSNNRFSESFIYEDKVCPTVTTKVADNILFSVPKHLSKTEIIKSSTFPLDYDFKNCSVPYVCGMSVPSFMMKEIANSIYDEWLSKL